MPRAFLIKKHSPGREVSTGKTKQLPGTESKNENSPSVNNVSLFMDLSSNDGRGPYDLSVKAKTFPGEADDSSLALTARCPPSVIEFSPKIVTSSSMVTPPIGIALIDRRTPSPNRLFKPGIPLEPLNPNTPPSSRTPPWHRPFMAPTYPPFSFPLYPLPRHASDFYTSPAPPPPTFIGSPIVSPPPLATLSPPRSMGLGRLEQLSPCIPRENVSPSSYYNNHQIPEHMHLEIPVGRKELNVYSTPWIRKEGSTSPISRSDSSDSCLDSANSNSSNKSGGVVSSSTGNLLGGHAPRYQCLDCNKSYSTYSGLSRHRQFHCITQAKKSFNCKYCDKVYVSLGALKMHIRTHTLPCKCKLCGKAFSRPWLLQGHIRTHTGEKPFACPHCSRAFADRSNLRAHLQTHSDIKKYSCKACSKTFSRMSLLMKHSDGGCMATQQR